MIKKSKDARGKRDIADTQEVKVSEAQTPISRLTSMANWDMKNHENIPMFTYVKINWGREYKWSDRQHLADGKRLAKMELFLLFI